jgi:uncharacterized protein (TIGR02466 family)
MPIIQPTVEPIFPIPTLHSALGREFTDEEIDFFNEMGKKTIKNEGNATSHNNYVLDEPELLNLRTDLMEVVNYWFTKLIKNKNAQPYITQSWLNWTMKDQFHHKHTHSNSYISGVLYIHGEDDRICFEKTAYEQIKIQPDNPEDSNMFNAEMSWFKVNPGKIILFPSSVIHYVDKKEHETPRVSLAFNIFVKGNIGKNVSLTELNL